MSDRLNSDEHHVFAIWQKMADAPFILSLTAREQTAQVRAEQLRYLAPHAKIMHFPAWDCLPYDRISPSLDIMTDRMTALEALLSQDDCPHVLVASVPAILQFLPPRTSFQDKAFTLNVGENFNRETLLESIIRLGYQRTTTVYEAGELAIRGSLMDIFPAGYAHPLRLDFFGDVIESLKHFDPESQRSLDSITSVTLRPVKEILLTPETIKTFRAQYRDVYANVSSPLYEAVSQGRSLMGLEHWLPLFFERCECLIDYLPPASLVFADPDVHDAVKAFQDQIRDYYIARLQDTHTFQKPLSPEHLYWSDAHWHDFSQNITPAQAIADISPPPLITPQDDFSQTLAQLQATKKRIIFTCASTGSRERLAHMFDQADIHLHLSDHWPTTGQGFWAVIFPLEKGFATSHEIIVSEEDLFGDRVARQLRRRKSKEKALIELSQLSPKDLVVHREHGIGRFEGLETVTVDHIPHDCLLLIYDGGDKLFLPVENIDLINRYGTSDGAFVSLDKLGGTAWQLRKSKVKKRLKEVAEYLLRTAAQRQLAHAQPVHDIPQEYDGFCASFPYAETDDQEQAIAETLQDLRHDKPMDRLICGDVGFGKTEVAMRAAFVVASQGRQVAVVTPTTLLCRQHTKTFTDRFRKTPLRIAQLSRLVKPKDSQRTKVELTQGQVDIVVATQAIFSDKVQFKDLGLLIVDEEHHFGVKQKERLKQLRADVHVLTLSATPIPRTLQMALAGIRELSLIRTPPIDRLAVRTFVGPFDAVTMREVIHREHFRGGQVFVVCPRIEEIAGLAERLREIAPGLRMGIAHGQMPAQQLEDVMSAFYDKEFDILLSTNIIESGIDVPSANTLIVYRADLLGLAQLYQLRGRVGRSKAQGYAYFTIPDEGLTSPQAIKRLEVLQRLDTLGAGFQLASYDLELRGAGNLVGEEQSGHIREVGLELYNHLLEEAIAFARAEKDQQPMPDFDWTPQINLGLAVLMPESYIPDLDLRLNLYRRLASLNEIIHVHGFAAELVDRFGKFPPEVQNLLDVMELKILCRQIGVSKIDAGPQAIVFTFHNNAFNNPHGLIKYIQSLQGRARLRPDHKVVFSGDWTNLRQRTLVARKICDALLKLLST